MYNRFSESGNDSVSNTFCNYLWSNSINERCYCFNIQGCIIFQSELAVGEFALLFLHWKRLVMWYREIVMIGRPYCNSDTHDDPLTSQCRVPAFIPDYLCLNQWCEVLLSNGSNFGIKSWSTHYLNWFTFKKKFHS